MSSSFFHYEDPGPATGLISQVMGAVTKGSLPSYVPGAPSPGSSHHGTMPAFDIPKPDWADDYTKKLRAGHVYSPHTHIDITGT